LQLSITARTGPDQWLVEAIATSGLLLTILGRIVRSGSTGSGFGTFSGAASITRWRCGAL
jgi:hypothetical protein